ncbi:MAG: hypothetical protein JRE19_14380 [Deltaproteobacteria bacterium]|nr:hypothetical protein [Deltaproteobacteria bacterium]
MSYLGGVCEHRARRGNAGHDRDELHLVEARARQEHATLRRGGRLRLERLGERAEGIAVLDVQLRKIFVGIHHGGRLGCNGALLGIVLVRLVLCTIAGLACAETQPLILLFVISTAARNPNGSDE